MQSIDHYQRRFYKDYHYQCWVVTLALAAVSKPRCLNKKIEILPPFCSQLCQRVIILREKMDPFQIEVSYEKMICNFPSNKQTYTETRKGGLDPVAFVDHYLRHNLLLRH